MFFRASRKKKSASLPRYSRFGQSPISTNRAAGTRSPISSSSLRSNRSARSGKLTLFSKDGRGFIQNISFPSLGSIKRVLLGLTTILILGAISYFIWFSGYFTTTKIYIQYDDVQNQSDDILTFFDEYKGKNFVSIHPEEKIPEVKTAHPELNKVTVEKVFPNTIKISFSEYPITANIESIINGKSIEKSIINSVGMAIYRDTENPNLPYIKVISTIEDDSIPVPATPAAPAPTTTPPVTTATTTPPTPEPAPVPTPVAVIPSIDQGIPLLTPENLAYILNSSKTFEEKFGMKIVEMDFLKQARELHLKTEKGFELWLDTQIPFEKQFFKLKKAMSALDIYGQPLLYIDLRISGSNGEKVIFKRKK